MTGIISRSREAVAGRARGAGVRRWLDDVTRREPPPAVHVLVRVLAVALPLLMLNPIFADDVRHFFDVGRDVGLDRLPYRDFL